MKKQSVLTLALALLLIAATASCGHHPAGSHNQNSPAQASPGVGSIHQGVGVVEAVDKQMATVQINHEDIKDYMPAMSMPFPVSDKSLLDVAGPGDRVEFSIKDTDSGMVLIAIKKQ